jgi:Holliday junction resolvase-like predicted endonuclease
VAEHLVSQGFVLLEQRLRTPFAELDIVAKDLDGGLHVFEVKGDRGGYEKIVSLCQILRLKRACQYLLHKKKPSSVRLHLAAVGAHRIRIFWDFQLSP